MRLRVALVLMVGALCCWPALFASAVDPDAPTLKQRQDCEVTVTKGLLKFNDGSDQEAAALFEQALQKWPDCYFASEQLGYLAEKSGELKRALEFYLQAKHSAPDERWPFLNFHIGRLYIDLKSEDRAETYLRVAQSQGAFPVQTNYLLGFLFYRQGRYLEAETSFHEALLALHRPGADETDRSMAQAIHYYMGEVEARLGFERQAIQHFEFAEIGDSAEVRRTSWRLHANLNRMVHVLNIGLFHRYDSNVALLSPTQGLPTELSGQNSHGLAFMADGWLESSSARRWGFGGGGVLDWDYHLTGDLGFFDQLQIAPAIWGRYSNLKTFEFNLRYDYLQTGYGRYSYSTYELLTGPTLRFSFFPGRRWTYSAAYQLQSRSYPQEIPLTPLDSRESTAHVLSLRAGMDSPNPWLRPYGQYALTANGAAGDNFSYLGHAFEGGADLFLFRRTEALAAINYEWRSYGSALLPRDDRILRGRVGLKSAILNNVVLSTDFNYSIDQSSLASFSWNRFEMNTGVIFRY